MHVKSLKIILPVIFFTGILSISVWAAEGNLTLAVALPTVNVEKNGAGEAVFRDEYGKPARINGKAGHWGLPWLTVSILLPPAAQLSSVRVQLVESVITDLADTYEIAPMPAPSTQGGDVLCQSIPADGRTATVFPAAYVQTVRSSKFWMFKIINVEMFSFQYDVTNKKLRKLVSGKLAVSFAEEPINIPAAALPPVDYLELMKKKTINFNETIGAYFPSQGGGTDQSSTGSPAPPVAREDAPTTAAGPGYCIITTDDVLKNSRELATYYLLKQEQGFDVHIITGSTWGGGTGDQAAENIRNWLAVNYITQNIRYALFIGDPNPQTGSVPMKSACPIKENLDYPDCPTDFYYAELTGNWDMDGDGYYGEYLDDFQNGGAETEFEIKVGRIPYYGYIEDLDAILAKLINYENSLAGEGSWRNNILLPMKPMDAVTPSYQLGEQIKTDIILPLGNWGYHRIYEETYNLSPPPEVFPCTIANVTFAWRNIPFGAVVWMTHGSTSYAADIVSTSDTILLNNSCPAFIYQGSCNNGYPEYPDNLGYALLLNGAANTVSSSRVSWYFAGDTFFAGTPTIGGIAYEYTRRLVSEKLASGDALNGLKFLIAPGNEAFWMNYLGFNIYGDPAHGLYSHSSQRFIKLDVVAVEASSYQEPHLPDHTLDEELETRWAAEGNGEWLLFSLDRVASLTALKLACYNGTDRNAFLTVEVSEDKTSWQVVFKGQTGYRTEQCQVIDLDNCLARYVKITGDGNTSSTSPNSNSYREVEVWGYETDNILPPIRTGKTEAETLRLTDYVPETNFSGPSGGEMISLTGAAQGTATGRFTGTAGTYNVYIKYVDEEDGAANWRFFINGILYDEWTGDRNTGTYWLYLTNQLTNVILNTGDTLEIAGIKGDGENARLDYLEISREPADSFIFDLNVATANPYTIAEKSLRTGELYYTDRTYTISGLPAHLEGASYIRTPNADKASTGTNLLTFRVTRPLTVYVAYDTRARSVPDWLSAWAVTNERILTTDRYCDFRLYAKSFTAGELIILGGNLAPGYRGYVRTNYFIIVN